MTIEEIIDGCYKNDKKAQSELYRMFYVKMKYVCIKLVYDKELALDYLQDGFIHVFHKFEKFKGKSIGELNNWITSVIRNYAIDQSRKSNRMKSVELTFDMPEPEDDTPEYKVSFDTIQLSINNLPPRYKEAFTMFFLNGMSHNEIAEELGISVGASKSNVFKAKHIIINNVNKLQVIE